MKGKNASKLKKILMLLFFIFYVAISILPFAYFVQNLNIKKNVLNTDFYFFYDATNYVGLSFVTLQTIYVSIFTVFIGAYFTILGIFLSNKKIAFSDFYRFSIDNFSALGTVLFLLQFIDIVFVFSLFPYIILTEFLLYFFILYIFIFAVYMVLQMTVIQNYKTCSEKFSTYANRKYEVLVYFYENFLCKCFPEKSYQIFDDFFLEASKNQKEDAIVNVLNLCIDLLTNSHFENRTEFEAKLNFIARRIIDCIQKKDFQNYDNYIVKFIETYFAKYKNAIFSKKCRYAYILEIRDSIFSKLLEKPENKYLQNYYKQIVNSSYEIIYLSFYHLTENTINQEISDFIFLKQFLEQKNEFSELMDLHQYQAINILVRLANCIKLRNRNLNVLKKYISILDDVSRIVIFDCDFEMYEEEIVHANVYTPIDTRNYYIGILLCYYCVLFGEKKTESIVKKIIYYKNEKDCYWQFSAVLDAFNNSNISNEDFCSYFSIANNKRKFDYVEFVKSILEQKINEIKDKKLDELKNMNVAKELEDEIDNQLKEIEKQFENFKYKNNENNNFIAHIKTNLCISKKMLTVENQKSLYFNSNYLSITEPFLYDQIMRQSSLNVIPINELSDIDGLSENETTELILPYEYYEYVYSSKIKNIEYIASSEIKINGLKIKLYFVRNNYGYILKKQDFLEHIGLKKIDKLNKEDWRRQGEDFIKKIDIQVNFAIDIKSKITCYDLEF